MRIQINKQGGTYAKVIMLGGGGFAREVMETIDTINKDTEDKIEPLGFIFIGDDVFIGVI